MKSTVMTMENKNMFIRKLYFVSLIILSVIISLCSSLLIFGWDITFNSSREYTQESIYNIFYILSFCIIVIFVSMIMTMYAVRFLYPKNYIITYPKNKFLQKFAEFFGLATKI